MNINDFDGVKEYPDQLLADIFSKQLELAEKYHPIEHDNGFWVGDDIEVNIHDKMGQHRIKDFCWRVTEELMESLEAWDHGNEEHCREEVADALHFMVELCLISGVRHEDLKFDTVYEVASSRPFTGDFAKDCLSVVYYLGLAANCLKNKPWKQTQMLTDNLKFDTYIQTAFWKLIDASTAAGIKTPHEMYDLYFRKNKVNQFRQESKY